MASSRYYRTERDRQLVLRANSGLFPGDDLAPGKVRGREYDFIFSDYIHNLFIDIRRQTVDYFTELKIVPHTMLAHMLSSQASCLNVLMPFATRPNALVALLAPLFPGRKIVPLPIPGEKIANDQSYVAFEWAGEGNYLGEVADGQSPQRGANSTSMDAMVLAEIDGRREMLLIEWKYTESYGSPLPNRLRTRDDGSAAWSNDVRLARYAEKLLWPAGPVRAETGLTLDALFWEPFYQFARQQMLAFQHEKNAAREAHGAERVSILHLAPRANVAFQRVTAERMRAYGDTACTAWQSVLQQPDRFESRAIEDLLAAFPAADHGLSGWANYIEQRYGWPTAPSPA